MGTAEGVVARVQRPPSRQGALERPPGTSADARDGSGESTTVEATLQNRIVGDNELIGTKVDCTEIIELAGTHTQPL